MTLKCLLLIEQNVWIESCYELLICRIFVGHVFDSKSLRRIEQNIWVGPLFVLFIWLSLVDNLIKSKSLLGIERNVWIESYYELFIGLVFVDHVIKWKFCFELAKIFVYSLRLNYRFLLDSSMMEWTGNRSLEMRKYLNGVFVWIIDLLRVRRPCSQLEIIASELGKYFYRIFVWITHLSCVGYKCSELKMFTWSWEKYWNKIFLRIIHSIFGLSYWYTSWLFLWSKWNIWTEFLI